ncbi:hypothetical protein [Aurantiacibacter hainanensis]|uniref:hypothetical protein n=1 Tax=Aurantiacibacter hainanensis TaxID=3076114 RepID=UPI0030C6CEC4
MTDINRLTVSLTKHNAHKVAQLLKQYDVDEVFDRLDEVHAEPAQARKNLSVQAGDILPPVWEKAKRLGDDAIDALVLVAIIFSHHELIAAMQNASLRKGFSGRIERGVQLDGKAYTNFVQIIDSLGYATRREFSGVSFNLKPMFELPGFAPLVSELLELKLLAARWDQSNSVSAEAKRLGFHEVFGVSASEFTAWVRSQSQPTKAGSAMLPKDEEFFEGDANEADTQPFKFQAGHTDRDVDSVSRSASKKSKARQLHNDIQNNLFAYLVKKLGARNVGTEVPTGAGTSVDLVTKIGDKITFYEIKTASTVRVCIRQALPQLLEYAYWPHDCRADELIIVSHLPASKGGDRYLNQIRSKFGIPIVYKQFDRQANCLK